MANSKKTSSRERNSFDVSKVEAGVRLILEGIGEDPDRPGIEGTPRRVALMYEEICAGLHDDPRKHLHVIPAETHDEMVIVKDIPLYSICEHHLLPFFGVAHIAYIPKDGRIVGLSKLARVADLMARKPQIQERLATEIADLLDEMLDEARAASDQSDAITLWLIGGCINEDQEADCVEMTRADRSIAHERARQRFPTVTIKTKFSDDPGVMAISVEFDYDGRQWVAAISLDRW